MRKTLTLLTTLVLALTLVFAGCGVGQNSAHAEQKQLTESVVFQIGTGEYFVNNQTTGVKMDTTPMIKDNRTMLPARFVAEALGYQVDWRPEQRAVVVWPKGVPEPDLGKVLEHLPRVLAYDPNAPFSSKNEFDTVWHVGGVRIEYGETTQKEIRAHLGEPQAVEKRSAEPNPGYMLISTYPLVRIDFLCSPYCFHQPMQQKADAWVFAIFTDKPSVFGPRNIHVGKSYETVLNKFPGTENPIEERTDGGEGYIRMLYDAIARPYGHMPVIGPSGGYTGYIFYDQNQSPTRMLLVGLCNHMLDISFKDAKVGSIYQGVMGC